MNPCEVAWFSALCDDDYEFLGAPDPRLQASFDHCRNIALTAESGGFDNLLLPSGYALGIDSTAFAAAIAPMLKRMKLLLAIRCGEMWPPQLARQLATINQMLGGRLNINIISSDIPGETLPSAPRYQRTIEVMELLNQILSGQLSGRVLQVQAGPAAHRDHDEPARAALFRGLVRRRPRGRRKGG